MNSIKTKISDIKLNPNNPRLIKDDKFIKLVKSIKDFPEMLNIRPIVVNKDMIILGGNMRFKACKEAGLKEIPVTFEKGTIRTNESRAKDKMFPLNRKVIGNINDVRGVKGADLGLTVRQPTEADFIKESTTQAPQQTVEQLRAQEQAEYAAMANPKDKVERKKIYDKYNKLITPLIKEAKQEVVPEIAPAIESIAKLKLDADKLESVIEELDFINEAKRKAERPSTSSKTKAKLNEDIAQYEANLEDKPNEVKIVKTINDNFDKIKKDLKDKGLLKVKC